MLWFKDLSILTPEGLVEHGALGIENGLIAEIRTHQVPTGAISLHGLTAIPGLVDLHGDMIERESLPRPGSPIPPDIALIELDKKLATSGITTAFAAISFAWGQDDLLRSEESATRFIETILTNRGSLLVDHFVHARFAITNPMAGIVLEKLLAHDKVHMVSLMDHTPGQGQYRDIEAYITFAIDWAKRTEGVTLTRSQILDRIKAAQETPKAYEAVRAITQVARKKAIPIASHDDDTPEKVELMVNLGATICEFPVSMAAARAARSHGLATIMGAPNAWRGTSHSGNLSAREAAIHGQLDILTSDYYPPSMLMAAFKLDQQGILPLPKAMELITRNPARAVGLVDRGSLMPGLRADFILVQTDPQLRIHATFREGIPVFADGFFHRIVGGHLTRGATPTSIPMNH